MRRLFEYGGIGASIVLVTLGVGSVVVGFDGRDRVRNDLAREKIVGTPDSPIAGQRVDTGSEAEDFAATMRKHTLEACPELVMRCLFQARTSRKPGR
jgi:hypothetical protein